MSGIDIVIGLGGQQNTSMIVRHTKHIPIFLRKQFRNGHCTLASILELEEEIYGSIYASRLCIKSVVCPINQHLPANHSDLSI